MQIVERFVLAKLRNCRFFSLAELNAPIGDCVAAIVSRLGHAVGYDVFNLGVDDFCTVDQSAAWICERVGVDRHAVEAGRVAG